MKKHRGYFLGWLSRPDVAIDKRLYLHGDVILVGKFVQTVVTSVNQLPIAMSSLDNRPKKYCIHAYVNLYLVRSSCMTRYTYVRMYYIRMCVFHYIVPSSILTYVHWFVTSIVCLVGIQLVLL